MALQASFVATRQRVVGVVGCCIGNPKHTGHSLYEDHPDGNTDVGDTDTPAGAMLKAHTDEVYTILHAIETAVHDINLLAIAVCMGMLAPVIGIAAGVSCAVKYLRLTVLDHRFGADGTASLVDHSQHRERHPLPVSCIGMQLVLQSGYTIVLLSTAGAGWAGAVVVSVNWVAFGAVCWWSRRRWRGDNGDDTASNGAPFPGSVDTYELATMLPPSGDIEA